MQVGTVIMLGNKRLALVVNETQCVLSDNVKITIPKDSIVFSEASTIIKEFTEAVLNAGR